MSSTLRIAMDVLLVITAALCWLGVLGMWRMRKPVQALQYMAIPGAFASVTLTIAVACQTGASQATAKCVAVAIILIAINSVVTHSTARAFRMRELGHWTPRPGDGTEFLKPEAKP